MVRLLQKENALKLAAKKGFNPTMVRLLLLVAWRKVASVSFQSHNGAIAAMA